MLCLNYTRTSLTSLYVHREALESKTRRPFENPNDFDLHGEMEKNENGACRWPAEQEAEVWVAIEPIVDK